METAGQVEEVWEHKGVEYPLSFLYRPAFKVLNLSLNICHTNIRQFLFFKRTRRGHNCNPLFSSIHTRLSISLFS